MNMRYIGIAFILALFLPAKAQQSLRADKASSTITYHMKHALHAWTGVSKDVNCIIQLNDQGYIEKVAATAKVKSFDSKNSNRDSHMLEVTDALSFPNVSFYSTSVTKQGDEYEVKGVLNFHGIERPLNLKVNEKTDGKRRTVSGSFIMLLEDHKVDRPTLFMVKTDNEVRIELLFVF